MNAYLLKVGPVVIDVVFNEERAKEFCRQTSVNSMARTYKTVRYNQEAVDQAKRNLEH